MKTLKLTLAFLVLAVVSASAQTLLLNTTTAAVVTGRATGMQMTSVTNIVVGSDLIIDQEVMNVTAIQGNFVTAVRGYAGTRAKPHANAAPVYIVPVAAQPYSIVNADPQGACTRGSATITNGVAQSQSTLYLPIFNVQNSVWTDCLGGVFQQGDGWPTAISAFEYPFPNTGATAYTSVGTSTSKATNTMYCSEFDLPYNKFMTGLAVLNGASTGTDKLIAVLYDASGNLLANSAIAGVLAAGSSTYQKRAFTTPYLAIGPALYFACVQGDSGTSATLNLLTTGTQDTYLTQSYGTQTFGTIPATITVPTSFTTLKGPYFFAY